MTPRPLAPEEHPSGVPVSVLALLIRFCSLSGASLLPMLEQAGVPEETLHDPDARISSDTMEFFWQGAAVLLNDPAIAVSVGVTVEARAFGLLGHLMEVSESFAEAIQHHERFKATLCPNLMLDLRQNGADLHVGIVDRIPLGDSVRRHAIEFALSGAVSAFARLAGIPSLPPQSIIAHFDYPPPSHASAYHERFGGSVFFNSHRNELILRGIIDDGRLFSAHGALRDLLLRQMEARVASSSEVSLRERLDAWFRVNLPLGRITLDEAAADFHLSPRSLQRHLKDEEGLHFSELLGQVRLGRATELLMDRTLSLEEIAFLLGYSEMAAFHRAFRGWTGAAPGAYRAGLLRDEASRHGAPARRLS